MSDTPLPWHGEGCYGLISLGGRAWEGLELSGVTPLWTEE